MSLAINTEANYEYESFVLGPGSVGTNRYEFQSVGRKKINYAAVESYLITGLGFQGTTMTVSFHDFLSENELNVYVPSAAATTPSQFTLRAFEITGFNAPVTYHEYRNPWCLWEGTPQGVGDRAFNITVDTIQPYDSIRFRVKFRVIRSHEFGNANDNLDTLKQWSMFKKTF